MSNLENKIFNNEVANIPAGVPDDQFTFTTISDLEIPADLQAFDEAVDPEYEAMLNNASQAVNQIIPVPTANLNSNIPPPAVGDYNIARQGSTPDSSTMEGKIRMFDDISTMQPIHVKEEQTFGSTETRIEDPVISGIAATQFDRYYAHPAFDRLGFHAYRNNEEFYNQNSSIWEDMGRMGSQLTKLMGTGFASSYRSLFDIDAPMDLKSAIEYEDAVRIGSSSRGGFGGGFNNFVLNSGYTLGIIGSIALEELVMWGATAAAAVVTAPAGGAGGVALGAAATARTAFNMKKLATAFRSIGQSFKVGKAFNATRHFVQGFKKIDRVRDAWGAVRGTGKFLGNVLAPETMRAFKELNSMKKAGENIHGMMKFSKKVGGVYRDMRSMNFALSEGRMEGGSVYKEQWQREFQIAKRDNFLKGLGDLTPDQLENVNNKAKAAALTTAWFNTPVIYLSNQLLLGNAFGGFKRSINQVAREAIEGAGGRIIRGKAATKIAKETAEEGVKKGVKQAGKRQVQKDIYDEIGDSFLNWKRGYQTIKSAGLRGGATMAGAAALRYAAANVSEGLQEVYQEAVSAGVKDYYTSMALDPMAGGYELFKSSAAIGIGEQFGGQGLETFASGFFMGGLVGGPQKLIFQGMPALYQMTANKEAWKAQKERVAKARKMMKNAMNYVGNEIASDPTSFFGSDKMSFVAQNEAGRSMSEAQQNDSRMEFEDSKDYAKLMYMEYVFSAGKQDFFREQLEDYLELTDQELAEAFPSEASRAKSGKLRSDIQNQINELNKTEEWFKENNDKIKVTADPSKYEMGSREYFDEQFRYQAQKTARLLYLFTKDGFTRAAERTEAIYEKLASDPVLKDIAANDLTVLLNKDTLTDEIDALKGEIALIGDQVGTKRAKKAKEKKLDALQKIADVLYAKENLKKDGTFDRRKMNKLMSVVGSYLDGLAKTKNSFVNNELLKDAVTKIIDHNHLSVRQKVYDKSLRVMTDPEYLDDMIRRGMLFFKTSYENRMDLFEQSIDKFINKEEINHLLNALANLGVYIDQESMLKFGSTGDPQYLEDFYNDKGRVNPADDPKLYAKIQSAVDTYANTANAALKKEADARAKAAKEKAETSQGREESVSEALQEAGIEGPESKVYGKSKEDSPVLDMILKKEYDKYRAMMVSLNAKKIPEFNQWINDTKAQDIIRAYTALKKMWFQTLKGIEPEARQKRFDSDQGFLQWMKLQKTNDLVFKVLEESSSLPGGVSFELFAGAQQEQGVTPEDTKVEGRDAGATVDIQESLVVDPETKQTTKFYTLLDKAGELIPEEIFIAAGLDPLNVDGFTSKAKALEARRKLSNYVPRYDSFEFDGQTLVYGQRVQDKKTKKWYVILSNPATVEKYGNLLVIEETDQAKYSPKDKIRKATKLKEGQFGKRFIEEEINAGAAKLPKNVSKLRVDEATAIIPHQRNRGTDFADDPEIGRRQLDYVIKNLTPKELNQIEVEITKNEDAGTDLGSFKYQDKEKNPFINKVKAPYNIKLVLPKALADKMNAELEKIDLPILDNGTLGYIPNNQVALFDKSGQMIDPLSITAEQVSDLFNVYGTTDQAASDIQQNFAVQYTIMNAIAEKMGDSATVKLSLKNIGGVNFFATAGKRDFNSDPRDKSVLDLNIQNVDGVTVVLENIKGKDGKVATRFITNAERDEKTKVQKKIIAEMNKQHPGLYELAQAESRYVMIVKSPSGVYTYFPVKSDQLSDESKGSIADALISRAVETAKNNLEDTSAEQTESEFSVDKSKKSKKTKVVKDLKYNSQYNTELNNGEIDGVPTFYIAGKPGYSFDINVGAKGSVFIRVFDRNLKESHNIIMSAEEVAQFKDQENKGKFIETLINRYNDTLKDMDAVKVATRADGTVNEKRKLFFENLKKDGGLKQDAFKISFDKNVTTDEIVEAVTTQIAPNVREASKLIATIDGVTAENTKSVPIVSQTTSGTFTPTTPYGTETGPTMTTTTESLDEIKDEVASLEELSKEDFDKLREKDFADLTREQKNYLAQRVAANEKLTNRELIVMNNNMVSGMINILAANFKNTNQNKSNTASPETTDDQQDHASLVKQLQDVESKIEARKDKIRKDFAGKLKNSEIIKKWSSDSTIKKLEKQKAEIQEKLSANKISDNLTIEDIRHIDEFLTWAQANLPDFITIEDIRRLGDNMKSGGERVGAFVMALQKIAGKEKIGGKLYVGATSKYAYHEAFHAVFRLLLTKEQQTEYYKLASKEVRAKLRAEGKNLKEEIEALRNGDISKYENWSQESLEKEYLEEYMADEFETFKQSPTKTKTNSWIKSLFNKILEWIRNVLGRFNGNQLKMLYEDISAGKFKTAEAASNPFTDAAFQGITTDASKLLRYKEQTLENGTKIYRNLPNKMGRAIVSGIAARVVKMEMENQDPNFDIIDAVDDSMEKYFQLYDIDNAQYLNASTEQLTNLQNITDAFMLFEKDIAESVIEELALYDIKLDLVDDLDSENEMEYGLRTTEQYDKDASQTGGFRSLSSFLRKYIGTTTLSEKDEFGNEYLDEETGERIIVPVDFGSAYSGFLKAAAGLTDPVRILQQLYIFSQNNPQTKAVQEKLFNDLGLVWEDQLEDGMLPGVTEDNLLFQAVLKGFENFKVDYLFLHTDTKDGRTISYSAANRDDAHTQVEKWETAYKSLRRRYIQDPTLKENASDKLDLLLNYLNPKDPIKSITNKKLNEIAKEVSQTLEETLGIRLHPDYIQYSIATNIANPTKFQRQLLSSKKDVINIQWDDIVYMKEQFDAGNDLMAQSEEEGVYNRLRKLGLGNAMFDETVGSSVFKNPNGDLVYAHQLPTFHLKKIASLNDVDNNAQALQDLIDQDPYLASNYLLNNPAFVQMSKEGLLKVTRISGSKSSAGIEKDSDGGVIEKFDRNEEGVVYGDYNPKQFLTALLNAYIAGVNPKSGKIQNGVIPEGQKDMVALAPVLLRVIEASNTGDMVGLPVIKAVQENKKGDAEITDVAVNAYLDNITAEFNRIKRELNPETKTKELIPGYNADKKGQNPDSSGRAYSFHNNRLVLTPVEKAINTSIETRSSLDSSGTVSRIREGSQRLFIKSDKAAKAIGFVAEGEVANMELGIGEEVPVKKGSKRTKFQQVKDDTSSFHKVKLLGNRNVGNLTFLEVQDKLGAAISETKTESHKHVVSIGAQDYYVESTALRDWLLGKTEAYVYEIVDGDVNEMSTAELQAQLDEAIEQEDYTTASNIRDILYADETNYATEIARVLKENAESAEPKDLSLDDALKILGKTRKDLQDFIKRRVDEEFSEFNREINNEFTVTYEEGGQTKKRLDVPKFLTEGLSRTESSTGDSAQFDIANNKLNLKSNYTHNLKQIFINDWINTSAMNDILLGDQAMSLKDAIDAVKRAKMQNAAYYSAASRIASPEHGVKNPLQRISMFAVTDPIGTSIYTNEEIEQSDAQNWMTVKAFRYMFFGFGKLTPTQAKLLDKIEAGEDISTEEIFGAAGAAKKQEMLNSKKLVYGDGKVFDKFSIIPLSKAMTSMKDKNGNWVAKPGREELHNMRVKMEQYEQDQLDQGVDTVAMVAPLSALKMMKKNVTLIDEMIKPGEVIVQKQSSGAVTDYMDRRVEFTANEVGNANALAENQVMNLDANFMGLQVLNPSNKLEIVDPTQIKTLLTGEQNDNVEVIIDGKVTTVGKLRMAYNKSVSNRLEQKYLDKRNLVFNLDPEYAMDQLHESIEANKITPDLLAFLQYARTSLMASQSSSQLLEFFSFDEQGNPNFDLNNPITEAKFKQLFLSYFSKSVMAEKIPGTAAALLSDYGFKQYRKIYSVDESNYIDRQEIIRTDDFAQNYSIGDVQMEGNEVLDLSNDDKFDVLAQRVSKLKKGEFIIVRDRLRPNMKEYNAKGEFTGIRYTESMMPAHSKEVYENIDLKSNALIPDSVSKMFGIRIPSQDNHSTINIKVVDFLPVFHGSTIVSARELVEVSGADFDIDKLYIQMKEYYEENGEFKEYKNNFEDYVRFINKAVQKKGSTFAEAATKAQDRDDRRLSDKKYNAAKELGFSRNAINALRILNLPLDKKGFNKYAEDTGRYPFSAGYNNEILDQKFALMGHTGVTTSTEDQTAVSYEAADMEILKDIWKEISAEVPELAEALAEDNIDANNLFGKWKGFANNKEGAKSIGAAVLPNLFLSLMQEQGLNLNPVLGYSLKFGGQVYDRFGNIDKDGNASTRERLEDGTEGRRKQYIISALITAMTDNAKERLAAKLGLSRSGLAVVTMMTAINVPIKTSVLLMNHPTIREAYKKESRAAIGEFNVMDFIEERMDVLKAIGAEYGLADAEEFGKSSVNQNSLYDAIKDPLIKFENERELKSKLDKAKEDNAELVTREQILRDYSILVEFRKANKISQFLRPVGDLMNLAKGFGVDSAALDKINKAREDLKLDYTDQQIADLPVNQVPVVDMRKVFTKDRWQTKMLEIFDEFAGSLLPKVFLNESVPYKNILQAMFDNMTYLTKEDRAAIDKDLLSYVTLRGYMHWLTQNERTILGTPDNALIYPEEGKKDIVDVYDQLKELNGDRYNYFLDGFVKPEKATDPGNKTGISMLSANTLTPLNESRKMDVQNGFRELFADPVTRGLTMRVLNYMIVKDGLQPVYKSLISAVSPEMFAEYLDTLPTTIDALASMSESEVERAFGMSFRDMKMDFLKNYTLHPKTARLMPKKSIASSLVFNGKSKITQSTGPLTKQRVDANPNKLFVIFDNDARNGSSNSKGVRDAENVFRITIKKNATNNESDFFSGTEENDMISRLNNDVELLKELSDAYDEIIIQNEIDSAELNGLSKFSPTLYDELMSTMQDNFNYKLTGLEKKDIKAEKKQVNTKAKSKPLYVSDQFDRATITVDLYKGITAAPKFEEGQAFIERKLADKKVKSKVSKNEAAIRSTFRIEEVENEVPLVMFPQNVTLKIDGKLRYFQLVRHAGPAYGNIGENLSATIAMGTFAQYIEVDLMGSPAQTPVGFIFGDRDTNAKVKERVTAANEEAKIDLPIPGIVATEQADYTYGTDPMLDQKLQDEYAVALGKDRFTFEEWLTKPFAQGIIKKHMNDMNSGNVTFEDGKIKVESTVPTADELKDAPAESSFSINPEDETDTINTEPAENADEGISSNEGMEKLEEFYDSLSLPQKLKLKDVGISNLADLEKESKKDLYKSIDDFIDQLKQCF